MKGDFSGKRSMCFFPMIFYYPNPAEVALQKSIPLVAYRICHLGNKRDTNVTQIESRPLAELAIF